MKKKRRGGLPKSYIKKYGMTKKAWDIYKADRAFGKKLRANPRRPKGKTLYRSGDNKLSMAKRKVRRIFVRGKKRGSRRHSNPLSMKIVAGMALTSTAEGFIDPLIANLGIGIQDDIIKAAAGYMIAKKYGGIARGVGLGLLSRGLGNVVGNLTQGGLGNIFKGGTTNNNDNVVV